MKAVIQRVANASVTVDGEITGRIEKGFLVLLGVGEGDTKAEADRIVKKLVNLRIFSDENGKINLSLQDVGGSLLVVSQFTLYADCRHGNRPSRQAPAGRGALRIFHGEMPGNHPCRGARRLRRPHGCSASQRRPLHDPIGMTGMLRSFFCGIFRTKNRLRLFNSPAPQS